MILAGDIGGTKTQLGLFRLNGSKLELLRKAVYPSAQYNGLEAIIRIFTADIDSRIDSAAFGIAGPIINGVCNTTNLPWVVSSEKIADLLRLDSSVLLNDLEAIGYGVGLLAAHEYVVLNEGDPSNSGSNAGIIAAGTGLGVACMFWDGMRHIPSASEGGHVDFAPRNELEFQLLNHLLKQHERVSVERIVSGPGIPVIYEFLKSIGYAEPLPALEARIAEGDAGSVISAAALAHECRLSIKTLDLFTSLYGAAAGNLALTIMATGGIYVGGGIAPKIIDKMCDGTFMRSFLAKGRFRPLLAGIPVRVILNDQTPLLGAARVAANLF
jgi:glucokinase